MALLLAFIGDMWPRWAPLYHVPLVSLDYLSGLYSGRCLRVVDIKRFLVAVYGRSWIYWGPSGQFYTYVHIWVHYFRDVLFQFRFRLFNHLQFLSLRGVL